MASRDHFKKSTPAELGFSMPAEWEPHEATWIGWPHNESDWPGKLDTIRWVYGEMVRKIAEGELVRILVRNRTEEKLALRYLKLARAPLKNLRFVIHPTNRGWTRDSGPIFVRRKGGRAGSSTAMDRSALPAGKRRARSDTPYQESERARCGVRCPKAETAIVHFHFNAWAKYSDWRKDRKVPETVARLLRKLLIKAQVQGRPFVMEGGGMDVNGRGTLLTTEECYLHPRIQVRNPGLTRQGYEETFKKYLGVKNVCWLRKGPVGDDTHGHIDDICRFVNSKTMVLIKETNKKDINYKPLAENWERIQDLRLENGSKPDVVALPMPEPLYFGKDRLPASYANFYISNAAVIVPTFNDPNDRVALGILGELFKDRKVVGIHAVDLVLGFGSLHCLTQQQPV